MSTIHIAHREIVRNGLSKQRERNATYRESGFVPTLFIGIGETRAYFTLRETHQRFIPGEGPMGNATVNGVYQGRVEYGSHHIQNLAQDPAEAIAKAEEIASLAGLKLRATNPGTLAAELREIERATAEEVAERDHKTAERIRAYQQKMAEQLAKWTAEAKAAIDAGQITFGRYAGQKIENLPVSYRQWVSKTDFVDSEVMSYLREAIIARYSSDFAPDIVPGLTVGKVGERLTLRVKQLQKFFYESAFGTVWVTKMIDLDTRALLVVKSTSWALGEGEEAIIKATVKEHSIYREEMQTILQRVKEVAP